MATTAMRMTAAAAALACAQVGAGEVQTHEFDLPTQNLSIFGVQFTSDFLGPPQGTIVETRATLRFTTGGSLDDAADIILMFQAPSTGVPIWQLTGRDLGWSGSGTFKAVLLTDELNGVIDLGEPVPDFSLFLLVIQADGLAPLGGSFSASSFEVDVQQPVAGDLDGDCTVGAVDLLELLSVWGRCDGECPPSCDGDLDGDCTVGVADLLELLGNWG